MKESIAAAHRRLDALLEETRDALTVSADAAFTPFENLRTALETHFDQEDRLYYPAIGSLRAELKASVEGFSTAHEEFRRTFAEIAAHLEAGSLADVGRGLDRFATAFTQHELAEEELLRALDREIALPS